VSLGAFTPALERQGLDRLLAMHPHLSVVAAWMPGRASGMLGAAWLRVDLGQPSEGERDAYAVLSFAIFRNTGAVYRMAGGAVEDDPLIEVEVTA
jgi:hypothetical protein